jgi:Cu+-exporting ATPase
MLFCSMGMRQLITVLSRAKPEPQSRQSGDVVFAGGRQLGARLELEVIKEVSQSYLTQLWHSAGQERKSPITIAVDRISAGFTLQYSPLPAAAGLYWGIISDIGTSINIMTAVLIVACPCALALSYPFTMGNAMRLMGRSQFFPQRCRCSRAPGPDKKRSYLIKPVR